MRSTKRAVARVASGGVVLTVTAVAWAAISLTTISTDTYTNASSEHATEVEPDTFSNGSFVVSAFQAGRFYTGGASNIGWGSTSDGVTWTNGYLPGITKVDSSTNTYDRVTDPSVAWDAKHGLWLIASLALSVSQSGAVTGAAVIVSRSTNSAGTAWNAPVVVATATGSSDYDKDWIVCDGRASSPHYGNCYVQWDDFGDGNRILMSTSSDGGLTWGAPARTADNATGIGGQPVVQPNGNVVVPMANASESQIRSFRSTDGGGSWSASMLVSAISDHTVGGGLRAGPLPSAEVDGAGKVYVVWQDCRFESGCKANDIVMTTSTDGLSWSTISRIPIDAIRSGYDHFIPGIAVDPTTSGSSAHIGLTYYYYPQTRCSARSGPHSSSCSLYAGFISSTDGGATWSTRTQLAGPMSVSWLASTDQGPMVGDYISTSFLAGVPIPAFATASAPNGSPLDEPMSSASGLSTAAGSVVLSTAGELPVPGAASDHAAAAALHRR
jgi:hypothetical protein